MNKKGYLKECFFFHEGKDNSWKRIRDIAESIKCKICNNSAYCLSIFDIWLSTFANRVHLILFHNARSPCVSISSFKGILWHTCADHAFSLPCATFFTSFYGMFQVKQTNSNKQSAVLHKSQILVKVSL